MQRDRLISGAIDYFRGDQWRRLLALLAADQDPTSTHAHVYTETCIDPTSLHGLIAGYFERAGRPLTRRIDVMAPRAGMGSLHGVEPRALAHFDWNWFYRPDVALAPSPGGEHGEGGGNLLLWNRNYVEQFYADFPFRTVGAAEETALRQFFASAFWHDGLAVCTRPTTHHGHVNCFTSIHPAVIALFAEDSLAAKGWTIDYTCPNVYLVQGRYTGKLVFMGRTPEAVYDLGWQFDGQTVIRPANVPFVFADQLGTDIWDARLLDPVLANPYVSLSMAEIDDILDAVAPSPIAKD